MPVARTQVRCQAGIAGAVITWSDTSNNETGSDIYQRAETSQIQISRGSEPANATAHSESIGARNRPPHGAASFNSAGESAIVWQTN